MPPSESSNNNDVPFVIGAGLGRTGTHSLQAALMELGHTNKPFHMTELLDGYAPPDKWFELAEHERRTGTRNKTLALEVAQSVMDLGYTATTDYPACLLFAEFLELRPDAKVILSVRSNAADWKKSVLETIGIIAFPLFKPPFAFMPFFRGFTRHLNPWLWERTGVAKLGQVKWPEESILTFQDNMEDAYEGWIRTVQAQVPKDRLLIHHAKDGYEPICKLLGVEDCPQTKYPHIGDTQHLKNMIQAFEVITQVFWPIVAMFVLVVAWGVKIKMGGSKKSSNKQKKSE